MIDYAPLWKTMKEQGISTYALIHKYDINPRTVNHLKHNKSISLFTLERLCRILNCQAESVVAFIPEEK